MFPVLPRVPHQSRFPLSEALETETTYSELRITTPMAEAESKLSSSESIIQQAGGLLPEGSFLLIV